MPLFRLLNARTLEFQQFWDETAEQYAILSHRWQEDEVSFQEMQDPAKRANMKGFAKIRRFCAQALKDRYDFVWVDSCCINKQSDAELTEAINSMFRWYQSAARCYLYMYDASDARDVSSSEVFTRGWTLQELIAPSRVDLYNRDWKLLGTKDSLSQVISETTKIDEQVLRGADLATQSIAQRMAWASRRKTTRVEDTAYCLLGIFGVNMPMLYGEGANAFVRLQQEIIRQSDDHSIFAWPITNDDEPGLLAKGPEAFKDCEHIVSMSSRKGRSPYSFTNRGLAIKLAAIPWAVDTYAAKLDFADERLDLRSEPRFGMFLRRLHEDDQYARIRVDGNTFINERASFWDQGGKNPVGHVEFSVKQSYSKADDDDTLDRVSGFRFATREILEHSRTGKPLYAVSGPCRWDAENGILLAKPGTFGNVGAIDIDEQHRVLKVIKLGFDFDFNPVCFLASSAGLHEKSGGAFDRTGHYNFGLDSQLAQYTKEELAQWPGIYQRDAFDQLAWNEIRGQRVTPLRQHAGLWALRGDRINGLHVDIPELARVRIQRGEWAGKLIWDVYLENTGKTLAGNVKGLFRRSQGS